MSESGPLVMIVSGPSGSGKSTLVEKILELPGTMLSVSCTTRAPRKTESDGKWYNFVSESEFQQMVETGRVSGIRAGVRKELVRHAAKSGWTKRDRSKGRPRSRN